MRFALEIEDMEAIKGTHMGILLESVNDESFTAIRGVHEQ